MGDNPCKDMFMADYKYLEIYIWKCPYNVPLWNWNKDTDWKYFTSCRVKYILDWSLAPATAITSNSEYCTYTLVKLSPLLLKWTFKGLPLNSHVLMCFKGSRISFIENVPHVTHWTKAKKRAVQYTHTLVVCLSWVRIQDSIVDYWFVHTQTAVMVHQIAKRHIGSHIMFTSRGAASYISPSFAQLYKSLRTLTCMNR